mgnify:CR=1 FL=1
MKKTLSALVIAAAAALFVSGCKVKDFYAFVDETMALRDSHDLGESLQYVLESVPTVDRAFVHQDYASWNLPRIEGQGAERSS